MYCEHVFDVGMRPRGNVPPPTTSQPYMFMELGPHAVTINSISAHVVTTDSEGNVIHQTPTTGNHGVLFSAVIYFQSP